MQQPKILERTESQERRGLVSERSCLANAKQFALPTFTLLAPATAACEEAEAFVAKRFFTSYGAVASASYACVR